MKESLLGIYRQEGPRVAAVQGIQLGGASSGFRMRNRRALAVMNEGYEA